MNNIGAFKKKWIENPSDEKGVLLYLPVSEVFISAKFGTGENLLKEDITRGFDDYIYGGGVCLIEWADLIREILPEDFVGIMIEKDMDKGFDYRKITLERGGVW